MSYKIYFKKNLMILLLDKIIRFSLFFSYKLLLSL